MSANTTQFCKRSILEALEYRALIKSVENLRTTYETNTKQKLEVDAEYYDLIFEELENVRLIIQLTNESLDAVNAKYADLQNPPAMYVTEQRELIVKLDALKKREEALTKKMNIFELNHGMNDDHQTLYENLHLSEKCQRYNNNKKTSERTAIPKLVIRAHLPNKQRTSIQVVPGVSLYQALLKSLKLRQLQPEQCKVTTTLLGRYILPWDTDISMLHVNEIYVQILDMVPIKSHISHQIVRKTFFSLTFCEACRRLLFSGFYCSRCDFRFHQNCFDKVTPLCTLPTTTNSSPNRHVTKHKGGGKEHLSCQYEPKIAYQGRSASTPNVWLDKIELKSSTNRGDMLSDQKWQIRAEEVLMDECVGTGSFGTVYKAYWHGTVAVKMLNLKSLSLAQLKSFSDEVFQLQKLRHSNLLLFSGAVLSPALAILTEWCENTTLFKHIHVNEANIELHSLIDFGLQIAQGMDYLHAKNIIHGDLKSMNVFIKDDFWVKLSDFGLSIAKSRTYDDVKFAQPTGSILWMAPEIIRMQEKCPYTFRSDVYAYGIIMYELTTSRLPYDHLSNKDQVTYLIGTGQLKPDMTRLRSDVPQSLQRFIKDCLKFKPKKRPVFPVLLNILENLLKVLPKTNHYASEPILTPTQLISYDFF